MMQHNARMRSGSSNVAVRPVGVARQRDRVALAAVATGAAATGWFVAELSLFLLVGCSPREPQADKQPTTRTVIAATRTLPEVEVEKAEVVQLTEPVTFVSGKLPLKTNDVLVMVLKSDPSAFRPSPGEMRRYWMFDRVRPQVLDWDDARVVVAVPNPGASLPQSLLWQTEPMLHAPTAEDVQRMLAEIGRAKAPSIDIGKKLQSHLPSPKEGPDAEKRQATPLHEVTKKLWEDKR